MTTVLYGGAFDPVHAGHLFVGHEALRLMAPSVLILVPTGLPNPEFGKHLSASNTDRLAMLKLAFAGVPDVIISDVELKSKARPSYFVDTLERLRPSLSADKPVLLVGEDQLVAFPQWHRYQDILDSVDLWYVPRASRCSPASHRLPARALFEINPFDSLSSTLIRDRLRRGLSVEGLVPPSVATYIAEHGLYRDR